MPPKRKAEESLAGPSKKRTVATGAGARMRAHRDARRCCGSRAENLGAAYRAVAAVVVVPGLIEITTRTAKEIEGSETLLMENGQSAQLAQDLDRHKIGILDPKKTLDKKHELRLQEAEQQVIRSQFRERQRRSSEELLIHTKLEMMQLVRTQFRTPNETDEEVRLSKMPNDHEAMKPKGDRRNPLYIEGTGRGRFYIETAAMWDDWCERMDAVAVEDRGDVLPRSYKEVNAAKLAREEELARAVEAQRAAEAAERAVERELFLELAETRRRLPPIPAHAPGQHPGYRRRKGQTKWSKRAVEEPMPPLTKEVSLKLTAPKKPVGKGKGKKRRNR